MRYPASLSLLAALAFTLAAAPSHAQDITIGSTHPTRADGFSTFDKPPGIARAWRPKPPAAMESAQTPDVVFYRFRLEPGKKLPTRHDIECSRTAFSEETLRAYVILMKFEYARSGGKEVTADFWASLIFNPASADPKKPNTTPRVLDATPLVLSQEEQDALLDAGWERDTLWADVQIDASGQITGIELDTPCAEVALPLVEANLRTWHLAPARQNGKPVAGSLRLPVHLVRKAEKQAGPTQAPGPALPAVDRDTHVACFSLRLEDLDTPGLDELPTTMTASPLLIPRNTPGFKANDLFRLHAQVSLDETGVVTDVDIRDGQSKEVRAIVESCLRSWRFAPPRRDGRPVAARVLLVPSAATVGRSRAGDIVSARRAYRIPADYPAHLERAWERPLVEMPLVSGQNPVSPGASISTLPATRTREGLAAPGTPALPDGSSARTFGQPTSPVRGLFMTNVVVHMQVDATGSVQGARIATSQVAALDAPAIAAVLRSHYVPALAQGAPVASVQRDEVFFPGSLNINNAEIFTDPQAAADPALAFDTPPMLTRFASPVFPVELGETIRRGKATARLHINPAGQVSSVDIVEATRPEFGFALQAAMEECTFVPAMRAGTAVPCSVLRTEEFESTLDSDTPPRMTTLCQVLRLSGADRAVESRMLDKPLALRHGSKPRFPASIDPATTGTVELTIYIDPDGFVRQVGVVNASAPAFTHAAVQAVSGWVFDPPRKDGRPVIARATTTLQIVPKPEPR